MADTGVVNFSISILPAEIRKEFTGLAASYSPADTTEGWYFKITDVTTSSLNLISTETYLSKGGNARGNDTGSAMATISPSDKVKFLVVIHTGFRDDGTTINKDSVYLTISGNTAAHNGTDSIEIAHKGAWYSKMNNATVADINVIIGQANGAGTGSNKIQCIVAAILDDV